MILSTILTTLMLVSSPASPCIDEILYAIRMVESGGNPNPDDGDGGKAIGEFQIHYAYWFDAVEFDKSIGGVYQDCRKRDYAEKIVRAYMRRYAPNAYKQCNAEIIARIHNGGPTGHKKQSTLVYWNKVKKYLK